MTSSMNSRLNYALVFRHYLYTYDLAVNVMNFLGFFLLKIDIYKIHLKRGYIPLRPWGPFIVPLFTRLMIVFYILLSHFYLFLFCVQYFQFFTSIIYLYFHFSFFLIVLNQFQLKCYQLNIIIFIQKRYKII